MNKGNRSIALAKLLLPIFRIGQLPAYYSVIGTEIIGDLVSKIHFSSDTDRRIELKVLFICDSVFQLEVKPGKDQRSCHTSICVRPSDPLHRYLQVHAAIAIFRYVGRIKCDRPVFAAAAAYSSTFRITIFYIGAGRP